MNMIRIINFVSKQTRIKYLVFISLLTYTFLKEMNKNRFLYHFNLLIFFIEIILLQIL